MWGASQGGGSWGGTPDYRSEISEGGVESSSLGEENLAPQLLPSQVSILSDPQAAKCPDRPLPTTCSGCLPLAGAPHYMSLPVPSLSYPSW